MKNLIRKAWWVPLAVAICLVCYCQIKSNCSRLPRIPGISHFWDIVLPSASDSTVTKPGDIHVHDKPVPVVSISEIRVDDGHIEIDVALDSVTTQTHKFDIAAHGGVKIRVIAPDTLAVDTIPRIIGVQPRFGFDLEIVGGPSIHGVGAGLTTLYWNRVWRDASLQVLLPNVEYSLWTDPEDKIYAGIGLRLQPFPKHTSLSLVGAWEWRLDNLREDRITVGAYLALFDF